MNITFVKSITVGMLKAYFKVQTGGTLRVKSKGRKADDADTLDTIGLAGCQYSRLERRCSQ